MSLLQKGQKDQTYREIRVKFALPFNKAAVAATNWCTLEEQTYLTGSVLGVK